MKKNFYVLPFLFAAALLTPSCSESDDLEITTEPEDVVTISLADAPVGEWQMLTEGTMQINASSSDGDNNFTYTSSSPEVANVDDIGIITAIAEGTTNIKIENQTTDTTIVVKVASVIIELENDDSDFENLFIGDEIQLNASSSDGDNNFTYTVTPETAAYVDDNGLVIFKEVGDITIDIANGNASYSVNFTVNEEEIIVDTNFGTVYWDDTIQISATSSYADDAVIVYSLADPADTTATVSQDGEFIGYMTGDVNLIATGPAGGITTFTVPVTAPTITLEFEDDLGESNNVYVGSEYQLIAESNDGNSNFVYSSDVPFLVTVDENGLVTPQVGDYTMSVTLTAVLYYTKDSVKQSISCVPYNPPLYVDGQGLEYSCDYSTNEATVTGFATSPTVNQDLTIPSSITANGEKLTVTKIAENAFKGEVKIRALSIGEEGASNHVEIGNGAFTNCIGIDDFLINSLVTYLPEACFYNCISLDNIALSSDAKEALEGIKTDAFNGCTALSSEFDFSLGAGLKYVEENAFFGTGDGFKLKLYTYDKDYANDWGVYTLGDDGNYTYNGYTAAYIDVTNTQYGFAKTGVLD